AQFNFADGFPSVTWSVLGHDRQAKLGYDALAAACAPVVLVTDPLPVAASPGERVVSDIHVINGARIARDDMLLSVYLSYGEAGRQHVLTCTGSAAADSCSWIGRIALLVPATVGALVLELELRPADPAAPPALDAGARRGELPV